MITEKQIQNLKDRQKSNLLHPYTCCSHKDCMKVINNGILIPKEDKWYCPCGDYTQEYKGEENDTDWTIIEEAFKEHPLFKFQCK